METRVEFGRMRKAVETQVVGEGTCVSTAVSSSAKLS